MRDEAEPGSTGRRFLSSLILHPSALLCAPSVSSVSAVVSASRYTQLQTTIDRAVMRHMQAQAERIFRVRTQIEWVRIIDSRPL